MNYQNYLHNCQARKQLGDSTAQRYCPYCVMSLT